MRGGFVSFLASLHNRMLHLIDPKHHHNKIDLQKIRVRDATVHVSRNSRLNDRKISTPCRPIDRKTTLGSVLLYKLTSHTTAVTRTSAGGAHRAESHPSRPSTLINLNLKLPPNAPISARTVLHKQASEGDPGPSSSSHS